MIESPKWRTTFAFAILSSLSHCPFKASYSKCSVFCWQEVASRIANKIGYLLFTCYHFCCKFIFLIHTGKENLHFLLFMILF